MPTARSQLRTTRRTLPLITPFFHRHRLRLVLGLAALLGVDFLQLLIPRVIKRAVDALGAGSASPQGLLGHGALIILLALGIAGLRFAWRALVLVFSRRLETDLRQRLLDHVLTLDRAFLQHRTTGEIMALSGNDLNAVQMACGMGLIAATDAVVMTVAALACMAYISPLLTLVAVAPMPLLVLCTARLSARLHHRFKRVQEQFSRLTEFARAGLTAIRLVKSCTQEEAQTHHFDRLGQAYIRDNMKVAMLQGTIFPLSRLVANLSLLLILYGGGRLAVSGTITVGDLVAFITYLYMLTWPMMAMGWVTTLFQRGLTSLGRLAEIFAARPTLHEPAAPLAPPEKITSLAFRNLSFRYPDRDETVLRELSVDFPVGLTGIVGPTGSGKTTLCQLLTRLYALPDNTLLINGVDANRFGISAFRDRIAYVPQEVTLFSDTIAANIGMGRSDATPEQIEAAARAVALDREIREMTDGYQTRIGEKGIKLSGGQRQRLALARALLLDRPVLILDDTLAGVDQATEQKIIAALRPYLQDRICIIVSHRLAPLIDADTILILDRGQLAAHASHARLLAENPFYSTIYRHQNTADGREEE